MSEFGDGSGAGDDDTAPITIYDIQAAEESKVRVRADARFHGDAVLRLLEAKKCSVVRGISANDESTVTSSRRKATRPPLSKGRG